MALYKMNVFHWHLTEDEAWRAEIKKYPKLTSIGGYPGDRSKDEELNGYYTQEQMREIVAYAHERYIKVVPEFDIPGHVNALLMAYPEYGCNDGAPLTMGRLGMRAFSSAAGRRAICAGRHETTIPFIMEVFAELQAIFTDGLFHIGGDERPRGSWETCTHCITLMKDLKLENEHYLQNWFLNEVSERLRKRDLRSIAWAEHLQGGVPEGQIVQAWNKASEVMQGVRAGRDVINSYNRKIYLDYPANRADAEELNKHNRRFRRRLVSTQSIYAFEPVPGDLTQEERARVIGVEAPVWTEDILMNRLDKKVFPRLISVAEVAWTPAEKKNWESFQRRLEKHAQILEALNVAYDRSDGIVEARDQ
jgi:hexosaminidase